MSQAIFDEILQRVDELSDDEQKRLQEALAARLARPGLTKIQFEEQLDQQGIITRPQGNSAWLKEPFVPVILEGEPLSQTIINERR